MRRCLPQDDRGLTLVELAVAIFILALGSIAALRATDQSRLAIIGGQDRALAQMVARNRAEMLRLPSGRRGALPAEVIQAGRAFSIETVTRPTSAGLIETRITAHAPSGAGAQLVVYLPVQP